jgi:hypothetical protein
MKKKKVYVLTVSRVFPKTHPRSGERTGFPSAIINALVIGKTECKIHTIRGNYELWKKSADKINAGEAVLSIRYWSGVPYQSKQVEFMELGAIGIERVQILNTSEEMQIEVEEKECPWISEVAKNDGLSPEDFSNWFFPKKIIKNYDECVFDGAIIHFTNFRYNTNLYNL